MKDTFRTESLYATLLAILLLLLMPPCANGNFNLARHPAGLLFATRASCWSVLGINTNTRELSSKSINNFPSVNTAKMFVIFFNGLPSKSNFKGTAALDLASFFSN